MAKTTTCAICGKEITKGLFKGEDRTLTVGDKFLTCCEDCYQNYKEDAKVDGKRFSTKVDNIAKTTNDTAEMVAACHEIQDIAWQNCPMFPAFGRTEGYAYTKGLEGVVIYPSGNLSFRDATFAG